MGQTPIKHHLARPKSAATSPGQSSPGWDDPETERPGGVQVLMSATLHEELFSAYFGGCPVVRVPGGTEGDRARSDAVVANRLVG